jgi:toxin-antitoxin system PIN domain toxin
VIAIDTNVLVYAHREEFAKHPAARRQLSELAEGQARWALPVFCIGEFLRLITHPRLFDPPYTADEGCEALQRILSSPSLIVLCPGPAYPELFVDAVREANAVGNIVFDAQIVAVCREGGVRTLLTEDRDFDRFQGFKTQRLK